MKSIFQLIVLILISGNVFTQELRYNWHFAAQGSEHDAILNSVVDSDGNSILVGNFENDLQVGALSFMAEEFALNGIIIKLDPEGNVIWAKELVAEKFADIYPFDVVVDQKNNILVAGSLYGAVDIDPSDKVVGLDSGDDDDMFFSKFDPDGNLINATRLTVGPSFEERGLDMEIASDGTIYLGGYVDISENANDDDIFLIQILPVDTSLVIGWNYYVATEGRLDGITEIAAHEDHVFITGLFSGTVDFDPTENELILDAGNGEDAFVTKLTTSGEVVWAINLGSNEENADCLGKSIRVDSKGDVYVMGDYDDVVDFDPGEGVAELSGFLQSFLLKLSADGEFIWVWDQDDLFANQVLINSVDDPFIAAQGDGKVNIRKLSSDGNLKWLNQLDGESNFSLSLREVDFDQDENMYVAANFSGKFGYDPNSAESVQATDDSNDMIYVKLSQDPTTSAKELSAGLPLDVYPNPVQDLLNIKFNELQNDLNVTISDVSGKVLHESNYGSVIDLSIPMDYPLGNYYLTCKSEQGSQIIKIVKG